LLQELNWDRFVQDLEWGSVGSFRNLREEVTPAQTPAQKQEKVKVKKKETPTNTDSLCWLLIVVVGWVVYWIVGFLAELVRENKEYAPISQAEGREYADGWVGLSLTF
jgi:flagellar biosynthesis/type III secretory pathway M-ring protein FliF/YscJ